MFIVYFIEITYKPYNICNKIISLSPLVFCELARAFCKKKNHRSKNNRKNTMGAFNCNWEIWIRIFSDFNADKSVLKVDLK